MLSEQYLKTVLDIWRERGEQSICSISGNCMFPIIKDGDTLVIEYGNENLRVGDVVVFGSPDEIYVHRVVRIYHRDGKEIFLLKADQHLAFHQPVTRDQILGKVIEARNTNKHLYLDSIFWKCMNYILSLRSYTAGRCSEGNSDFWKGMSSIFALRTKLLPKSCSTVLILRKVIIPIYQRWCRSFR